MYLHKNSKILLNLLKKVVKNACHNSKSSILYRYVTVGQSVSAYKKTATEINILEYSYDKDRKHQESACVCAGRMHASDMRGGGYFRAL